jgi:hypothetical protein
MGATDALKLHPESVIELLDEDGVTTFRQTVGEIRRAIFRLESFAITSDDPEIAEEARADVADLESVLLHAELEIAGWPEDKRAEHLVPVTMEPINARYID